MREHTPSATALRVAALRALHQTAETPPILVDPLAERVIGPDEGAGLLGELGRSPAETARLRATLAVRSRVAEEAVGAGLARGVDQCVVLGAGLDTFAYRHGHRDLRVFEVDHPATQAWKRERLRAAGLAEPASVHSVRYVTADFLQDDPLAALAAAGFDPTRPAVLFMLGVVLYLDREVIERILRAVGCGCARGSELVFDYTEPFHAAARPVLAPYAAAAARVAAVGEPWKSFFEPAVMHGMLRAAGFCELNDLDAATLDARYCAGRADGLKVVPLIHLMRARL